MMVFSASFSPIYQTLMNKKLSNTLVKVKQGEISGTMVKNGNLWIAGMCYVPKLSQYFLNYPSGHNRKKNGLKGEN